MNSTAPPVEEREPTLRDVLVAVNGLGTRMDSLEGRVGSVETGLADLREFCKIQYGQLSTQLATARAEIREVRTEVRTEIGAVRAEVAVVRTEVGELRAEVAQNTRSVRAIEPQAEESVRIGRANRAILVELQGAQARMDAKIDLHVHDSEIHLPQQVRWDDPQGDPMAA